MTSAYCPICNNDITYSYACDHKIGEYIVWYCTDYKGAFTTIYYGAVRHAILDGHIFLTPDRIEKLLLLT